jgi:hypothetical protein
MPAFIHLIEDKGAHMFDYSQIAGKWRESGTTLVTILSPETLLKNGHRHNSP